MEFFIYTSPRLAKIGLGFLFDKTNEPSFEGAWKEKDRNNFYFKFRDRLAALRLKQYLEKEAKDDKERSDIFMAELG